MPAYAPRCCQCKTLLVISSSCCHCRHSQCGECV